MQTKHLRRFEIYASDDYVKRNYPIGKIVQNQGTPYKVVEYIVTVNEGDVPGFYGEELY